tara:strand:+ start:337 stop:1020 length:684 start_codon:yes stop_codon:yes gene_type:complete
MNTCVNCGEKYDNIDEHQKNCKSSFISKEFENLIPCEICNTLVNFDDYNDHLNTCSSPLNNMIFQNGLFSIFNIPTNNSVNYESEESQETLESDDNIVNQEEYNINLGNNNDLNNHILNIFGNIVENIENNSFSFNSNIVNNLNLEEDSYENLNNISESIGDVNIGVANIDKYLKNLDSKITCPICCEDFNSGVETVCNHQFCKDCITEWLNENNKCPICLYEFIEK